MYDNIVQVIICILTFILFLIKIRNLVQYYHHIAQIAIIKVPRDHHKMIRAALTLLTEINHQQVVTNVISINGSARTCKIAALRTMSKWFHNNIIQKGIVGADQKNGILQIKFHREMEEIRVLN